MVTTISYIREGRAVKLVRTASPTGLPKCVQCGRVIPKEYRRYYDMTRRKVYFCTDKCAISFANYVASQTWVDNE